MKKILGLVFVFIVSLAVSVIDTAAQDGEYQIMAGTDTPVSFAAKDGVDCFVFEKYTVRVADDEEGGANVAVYPRFSSSDAKTACDSAPKHVLFVPNSDNNAFFGIAGPLVFVDQGTSVESRNLVVYDLSAGNAMTGFEYNGDPKLVDGRYLLFDSPSAKAGPIRSCKQAAEWKRQGGGVGWVQGQKVDLQTKTKTPVGGLKCVYMQ